MRPEEVTALGDLAGEAAAGFTSQIRDMHDGIAERAFRAVGASTAPVTGSLTTRSPIGRTPPRGHSPGRSCAAARERSA